MLDKNWQRVDDKKLHNTGGRLHQLAARCYGVPGKPWPRLVVKIVASNEGDFLMDDSDDIRIDVNRKKSPRAPWEQALLPVALVGDLREMLAEVLSLRWTSCPACKGITLGECRACHGV